MFFLQTFRRRTFLRAEFPVKPIKGTRYAPRHYKNNTSGAAMKKGIDEQNRIIYYFKEKT